MNKTPISILQEMMVKQAMVPKYELVHDGGGTHMNTFIYQVTCDGLSANGTGRCKKDAKHEAAKAMLTMIAAQRNFPQLPAATTPESPIRSPLHGASLPTKLRDPTEPFFNAIGVLQDLCTINDLEDPVYIPISTIGPPHARVFTIRCKVSNFLEDGIATTKKQAKHEAARKMIDKIQDLVKQFGDETNDDKGEINENKEHIDIKENENGVKTSKQKKANWGIKLSEYHLKWRDSIEIDKRIKILMELDRIIIKHFNEMDEHITDESIMEILNKVQDLLADVNVTINMMDLATFNNYFMKIIKIDISPVFTHISMGTTKEEASWQALLKMIDSIKLLLS